MRGLFLSCWRGLLYFGGVAHLHIRNRRRHPSQDGTRAEATTVLRCIPETTHVQQPNSLGKSASCPTRHPLCLCPAVARQNAVVISCITMIEGRMNAAILTESGQVLPPTAPANAVPSPSGASLRIAGASRRWDIDRSIRVRLCHIDKSDIPFLI